ncbi:Multidrug efflux pump subunit AcrA (membrane-fusion protein) [Paenibacillus sp. UNCCL117]|uniref:efflux RND transporter periplasmic adaptor subunit n=1 Tax=unclassified Paenibacillus TaxID=185978 RepID=UPI00088A280D|nr:MULTISPECIES: biotin/lipoyl-binding protein [unclassified Paenibacillus]SDE14636.1 Multidrug efflux pump subunit AcrA (membrane-fusion protein) [Paenibacillus sp. cl123]SFW60657.1 Multidrug efflux pump subunit AcrA (membrane-fusion protein) [Paenibacillus sp. UNCCL117]
MEALINEEQQKTRKRNIAVIASLFFACLIALTLFGNTLVALTLPKVITEQPVSGTLDLTFQGTAILRSAIEVDLTNPGGLTTTKVLVKEGDAVRKGQILVQYDNSEAEQQIDAEQDVLKKTKLDLNRRFDEYKQVARGEDPDAIAAAQNGLESVKLDITAQEKRIRMLQTQMSAKEKLLAPFDGIVTAVNAIEGLPSTASDIRLFYTDKGLRFDIQVPIELAVGLTEGESLKVRTIGKKSRLLQGQIMKIEASTTPNESDKPTNGPPTSSTSSGESPTVRETNRLLVSLHDESLHDGDRVQVELSKTVGKETLIISSKAVRQDRNGAYVFALESTSGPLGNVYYASKRPVTVSGANEQQTAISGDFLEKANIILESSEPLEDGQRVRY